eukprot:149677_1
MPLQPISNLNKSTNNNNNNKYIECETHTPVPLSPDSPIQSDIELSDSTIDLYLDTIKENDLNTSCFAKLILCICIPYCYWDSLILIEYKKRRSIETSNGTISKSFKAQIISNISYFGLFMNLILLFQCICLFILYEYTPLL